MPGDKDIIVADADVLISTLLDQDSNHDQVMVLREKIAAGNYDIRFPNTAILEAITVLRRVFDRKDYVKAVNDDYLMGKFTVVYVDEIIQKLASSLFAKTTSKKNTIFDAVVLATAQTVKAAAIFSFDSWYKKQGAKTIRDLIGEK